MSLYNLKLDFGYKSSSKNSGSLITVDFALEQGRDVYAVPGNILDNNSKGVNSLIKEGAKVLDSYEDLID